MPLATASAPERVRKLVWDITAAIVDDENSVVVEMEELDTLHAIKVQVASAEVGRIIGSGGRTARSIRTLLSGISMKQGKRYTLDIRE